VPPGPDLIRDGVDGLLVPPQNPELLAAAVRTILDDPALAARLSAAGCHRAARYGWPALQDKVLAVYEKLRAG
jgi:glycogen(starch) synthase